MGRASDQPRPKLLMFNARNFVGNIWSRSVHEFHQHFHAACNGCDLVISVLAKPSRASLMLAHP